MYRFSLLFYLFVFSISYSSCKSQTIDFRENHILIASNGDNTSMGLADYFYNHLNKRNKNKEKLRITRSDNVNSLERCNIIYFEYVADLDADYELVNTGNKLSIYSQQKSTIKWLSYMLIDHISNFHNIEVSDLPPSYIDFQTKKYNFAFKYRDPHLRPNLDQDISGILHTHNVDNSWGLWGHNLSKVFTETPIHKSFASVNGIKKSNQFCFSSENTFKAIDNFVLDEYGDGRNSSNWFMISPNDNDLVCTCESCIKLGNTNTNATPAVINLILRLAEKYPNHHFLTTAYRTTKEAAKKLLLNNTGVLYSTIDLSKLPSLNADDSTVIKFVADLEKWKQQNAKVYLWDYISNFDDYLTPYPVVNRVKNHLTFFKSIGVEGIFLNGSGYDYSPFDDVKTYVLSALLIDPNLSVSELITKYFDRFYPVSKNILTTYYLDLENDMSKLNKSTPVYSSFRDATNSYFNMDKFIEFYDELRLIEKELKGIEKERIRILLDALSYTKLQVIYHKKESCTNSPNLNNHLGLKTPESSEALLRLKNLSLNNYIKNYKEDEGSLNTYISNWKTIEEKEVKYNNLIGVKNKGKNSEESPNEINLLYNGLLGFPSDFNQGWFLSGEDLHLECILNEKDGHEEIKEIKIIFLINNRHRMLIPDQIEIIKQGKTIGTFSEKDLITDHNTAILKKKIQVAKGEILELKIKKNKELKNSVIACDEIQLY